MIVVALGFFDGVHIGHTALLKRAAALSRDSHALTFDVPPELITQGRALPLINTAEDRELLLKRYVSGVLTVRFDRDLMKMNWQEFISSVLVEKLNAGHVVAGHDFRFGSGGEGDTDGLKQECARLGIGCDIIDRVELNGITVSSTHIRGLIESGDVEAAAEFLGHPHILSGVVTKGRGLGTKIGAPTANLTLPDGVLPPAYGVYLTRTMFGGTAFRSVTNVGVSPTVTDSGVPSAETTILGYDGDLYGRNLTIEFHKLIRPEIKFGGADELKEQIKKDLETARGMELVPVSLYPV